MDAQRYADLFQSESREQLSEINRALIGLEAAPEDRAQVHRLFRALHTLKGMSATMGYSTVAAFSHELENVLERVRAGEQDLSADFMDALFAAADALEDGVAHAVAKKGDTPALAAALQQLWSAAGHGTKAPGDDETAADVADAAAAAALVDNGPGVLVRVRQRADTALPGVRAFMVMRVAGTLGQVIAVSPPLPLLQAAESAQAFAFRLVTQRAAGEIEAAVTGVGDIEHVEVSAGRGRQRVLTPTTVVEDGSPTGARQVRVDVARLDSLMQMAGELALVRGRLQQLAAQRADPALDEATADAARLIGLLQTEVMATRMVPAAQVLDRFPRLVRDAARALGKEIVFTLQGRDLELDRFLLDEISEPVMHLLRNAVDHGIEMPDEREAVGKPRAGALVLSAERHRSAVVVRVRDDGRGIDRRHVLELARTLGVVGDGVEGLDDAQLLEVIGSPGFSTALTVSDLSGRGVGFDAVLARVRRLGGVVSLESESGSGTTVTLRLPFAPQPDSTGSG